MAKRGRKPTPTALKLLKGTRSDRVPKGEPPPLPGQPERPAYLDAIERAEWDRMIPILEEMGVLSRGDGGALALYCSVYGRWLRAKRAINGLDPETGEKPEEAKGAAGLTDQTAAGAYKVGAFVQIMQQAERDMLRLLTEFGLTPSSRARVATSKAEGPKDDLGDFLKRRRG